MSANEEETMASPDRTPQGPKTGFEGVIEAVADLLQTASDWVRQEAEAVVREKIVRPIQKLGLTLVSASAAGCLIVLGLAFIAVALFLYLAGWLGYPGALLLIGGVYLLLSVVFIVIKARSMLK
jgi:hypothetical protein